jgi:hypothetical protein
MDINWCIGIGPPTLFSTKTPNTMKIKRYENKKTNHAYHKI